MGKCENNGYFRNYCSLRFESWQQTTNEGIRLIKVKVISWAGAGPQSLKYRNKRLVFLSNLSVYKYEILFEAFNGRIKFCS